MDETLPTDRSRLPSAITGIVHDVDHLLEAARVRSPVHILGQLAVEDEVGDGCPNVEANG